MLVSIFFSLYLSAQNDWVQDGSLSFPNPHNYDRFGWAMSMDGDLLAVGALTRDPTYVNAGSAFIYQIDPQTGAWNLTKEVVAPDPDPQVFFG
jgi:hypothetical protein